MNDTWIQFIIYLVLAEVVQLNNLSIDDSVQEKKLIWTFEIWVTIWLKTVHKRIGVDKKDSVDCRCDVCFIQFVVACL